MAGIVTDLEFNLDILTCNRDKIFIIPVALYGRRNQPPFGHLANQSNVFHLPVRREPISSENRMPYFSDKPEEFKITSNILRSLYKQTIPCNVDFVLPHDLCDSDFARMSQYSPKMRKLWHQLFLEHFGIEIPVFEDESI